LLYGRSGRLHDQVQALHEAIEADAGFARAYLFLAKAYLDLNENFGEAVRLARKGIELDPEAESAPLGHYVLSDIYNRLGRPAEAAAELEKGRTLQRKIKESGKN
jgi:tetratricopeptide (TPR) repeat protein